MSKDDAIRKTVGFSEDENYLLEFALKQDKKFATYVKSLIKQDYINKNSPKPIDNEIKKQVEEIVQNYLKSHNLELKENATDEVSKFEFEDSDKNALMNFMYPEKK